MQGVIRVFADAMGGALTSLNMGWMPIFGLLHVAFFVIHYMFASQTAHVGALYSAFCAMMLASGEASGWEAGKRARTKGHSGAGGLGEGGCGRQCVSACIRRCNATGPSGLHV